MVIMLLDRRLVVLFVVLLCDSSKVVVIEVISVGICVISLLLMVSLE